MATTCGLSKEIVGPFNQTLFLGCSVVSFNSNLGWGADSSTLSVELAEDTSSHPQGARLQQQFYDRLKDLKTTNDNLFKNKNIFGSDKETDRSEYSEIGKKRNNRFITEDPYKNAHITILKDIVEREEQRKLDNRNINTADLGKRYYDPYDPSEKLWWLDEDPGFLGVEENAFSYQQIIRARRSRPRYEAFELLGVPVIFRYGDNYTFGGLVSQWTKDTSSTGISYKLEIKNFSNLLKNTHLIIGHYSGSIANSVPNTGTNYIGKNLSAPGLFTGGYNSTTAQGNIPNVINVYGYLESFGFGNAKENENGIPAYKIYDAIQAMLGASGNTDTRSHFNPYGGLVARSISTKRFSNRNDGEFMILNPSSIAVNGLGGRMDLTRCGIMPHVQAVDSKYRPVFKIDMSEIPRPPEWLRISSASINLLDFITQICTGAGFDFFVDFVPYDKAQTYASGVIKIRTVSRRYQPRQDVIAKYIEKLESEDIFISRKQYGKEYNDSVSRTMYIGGKQKRLLQCRSHRFTWSQKFFSYDAFANNGQGGFVNVPTAGYWNSVRKPEPASYRSQNYIRNGVAVFDPQNLPFTELTGPFLESPETSNRLNFVNQPNTEGIKTDIVHNSIKNVDYHYNPIKRGNYQDSVHNLTPGLPTLTDGSMSTRASIPIHHDVVCPYFGKHYDGTIRKVYYDPYMGQVQIVFKIDDLIIAGTDLSFIEEKPKVTHFVVYENELRAAGTGFDQWLSYCFDNGFYTDIEKLVYRALYRKYGAAANIDIGSVHKGFIESLKSGSFPNNISQLNYANASIYGDSLYSSLRAIYQVFNKIANEFYGKAYMVSVPGLKTYRDFSRTNIIIGYDLNNQPIYAVEGSGKLYTDFEIAREGAWEEPGNYIDDAIIVGSMNTAPLLNDQNLIQPIVGFNSSITRDVRPLTFWRAYLDGTLSKDNPMWISNRYVSYANGAADAFACLLSDVSATDYVNVPDYTGSKVARDALNQPISPVVKTYIKADVEDGFEFLDDNNLLYPKAILKLTSPVYLNNNTPSANNLLSNILHDSFIRMCEASPITSQISKTPHLPPEVVKTDGATMALDYLYQLGRFNLSELQNLLPTKTSIGGLVTKTDIEGNFAGLAGASQIIRSITNALEVSHILSLGPGLSPVFPFSNPGQTATSYNNAQILPKAAIPTFAAVPVQLNQAVYGPWINYPALIAKNIFVDYADKDSAIERTENLIGGVKVEIQESLTPWEFGSMTGLDKQAMLQIGDDVDYQQLIETGSLDLPIFPDFSLGSFLDGNGPLTTRIGVNIGQNGVVTTISFRTYSRKLGLFNKENADRLKALSLETIRRNKEIVSKYNELRDRIKNAEVGSSTSPADLIGLDVPKMLRWSPMEMLVGSNSVLINKNSDIRDLHDQYNYNPSYMHKPYYAGAIAADVVGSLKQVGTVTVQDFRETPRELMDNYAQKSIMSLDGLMSPVSLFPTPHHSTFHIVKYDTRTCPICRGTKSYLYNHTQSTILTKKPGIGANGIGIVTKTVVCDFCEDKTVAPQLDLQQNSDPPHILTNSSDTSTLLEFQQNTSENRISYKTYNPIVLTDGEFGLDEYRQSTDKSAHCINTVSYGSVAPYEYQDGLRHNYSTNISDAYTSVDRTLSELNRQIVSNNHRFFGFKGPMVLHSWGYDTEGYPVPNRADQPVIENGVPKRKQDNTMLLIGEDPNDPSVFNREETFYNGWAQLPATWPVGPIDFRWDRNRKVWTIGEKDKHAFVVLEEDLTDLQPVRGALWNNSFLNNKRLPDGYRKLVYVKDNKGITAPRGAKIYCLYSSKNGFYEPIYANSFMASGTINGSNSVTIHSAYSSSQYTLSDHPLVIEDYTTNYSNPLNYTVSNGSIGLFTFIDGKWVLQNYNSCGA